MSDLEKKLDEELEVRLDAMQEGHYEGDVDDFKKLYELRLKEKELSQAEAAAESAKAEAKDRVIDRIFRVGLTILEVGLPLLTYSYWQKAGYKYEDQGLMPSSGSMRANTKNLFTLKFKH